MSRRSSRVRGGRGSVGSRSLNPSCATHKNTRRFRKPRTPKIPAPDGHAATSLHHTCSTHSHITHFILIHAHQVATNITQTASGLLQTHSIGPDISSSCLVSATTPFHQKHSRIPENSFPGGVHHIQGARYKAGQRIFKPDFLFQKRSCAGKQAFHT